MSKRFGRNRKRKLLKELSDLKDAHSLNVGLSSSLTSKLRSLRQEFRQFVDIVERISPNSIAIPIKEVLSNIPLYDRIYRMPLRDHSFNINYIPDEVIDTILTTVNLNAFEIAVNKDIDRFRYAVHLKYGYDKYSYYLLSEQAFKSIPIDILCNTLMPQLISKIKELYNE